MELRELKQKCYTMLSLAAVMLCFASCGSKLADVPEGSEEISVGDNDIMMVYIEPGTFTMGATMEQKDCNPFKEKPKHSVQLTKPYYISQTEVTQELWEAVMDCNPSLYKAHNDQEKNLPVLNVSWYDCQEFIKRLNQMTGRKFRLPTEAEWEYAARGAGKGFQLQYAGSKFPDVVACWKGNSDGHPFPVACFGPNEVGIYDMSGNVWEWVQDNYQDYKADAVKDPCVELADSLPHAVRGGSFIDIHSNCRTSTREACSPEYKQTNLGFRLAMSK